MKSYIFTIKQSGRTKNITIYRIVKGKPKQLTSRTDQFCDDFQLFIETMHDRNLILDKADRLPMKAFEKNQWGGWKNCNCWVIEDNGVAKVTQV